MIVCERRPAFVSPIPDAAADAVECAPGIESVPPAKYLVEPGTKLSLAEIDPTYPGTGSIRERAIQEARFYAHKLDQLQLAMYAEKKASLLIILQGLDASGKDGVTRHLLNCMNPAGCRVIGFKKPSRNELAHDFLWRIHAQVPAKGEIAIFNRSHYEDVLVVRVHGTVDASSCWNRYALINDFEELLATENNTTILKFLLYVSKDEQLARFKQRLEDPKRRWKISESDYKEREYWDQYMHAFEDMLHRTSTNHAPWYVIPSNNRWYRDLTIARIVTTALEKLGLRTPEPTVDISRIRCQYHAAEAAMSVT
jgi:PPK2 family polyphosphate:nucleotide phosphotransferase